MAALVCLSGVAHRGQEPRRPPPAPLYPFVNTTDGKVGFIDAAGNVSIRAQFAPSVAGESHPIYSLAALGDWKFSEGLARVRVGGESGRSYGYINEKGEAVIPPRFVSAGHFSGGLAPVGVRVKDKIKYGYINVRGEFVVQPLYDYAQDFSEGLAAVATGGRYGLIDATGKVVIKPVYDEPLDFSEGLAAVRVNWRYGFIDKTGRVIIKPLFRYAEPFSEGLALVSLEGGNYGFIDKKGVFAIKPQFTSADNFSEGLARVTVRTAGGHLKGYVDTGGRLVIKPQFTSAGNFSEGLAWVGVVAGDVVPGSIAAGDKVKYGYINKRGEVVVPPTLAAAGDFSGGLALVGFEVITRELGRAPGKPRLLSTKETIVYGYITAEGKPVFKGVWLFDGRVEDKSGTVMGAESLTHYSERGLVPVKVVTTPGGAAVYFVPFLIWDTTPGLIDDASKLFNHRQTKYTTETFDVAEDVYVLVLEHEGRRCAVKKDVNQYSDRTVELDFNKEGQCRKAP